MGFISLTWKQSFVLYSPLPTSSQPIILDLIDFVSILASNFQTYWDSLLGKLLLDCYGVYIIIFKLVLRSYYLLMIL